MKNWISQTNQPNLEGNLKDYVAMSDATVYKILKVVFHIQKPTIYVSYTAIQSQLKYLNLKLGSSRKNTNRGRVEDWTWNFQEIEERPGMQKYHQGSIKKEIEFQGLFTKNSCRIPWFLVFDLVRISKRCHTILQNFHQG